MPGRAARRTGWAWVALLLLALMLPTGTASAHAAHARSGHVLHRAQDVAAVPAATEQCPHERLSCCARATCAEVVPLPTAFAVNRPPPPGSAWPPEPTRWAEGLDPAPSPRPPRSAS